MFSTTAGVLGHHSGSPLERGSRRPRQYQFGVAHFICKNMCKIPPFSTSLDWTQLVRRVRVLGKESSMRKGRKSSRDLALCVEQCEARVLNTLVFVLNGNAFAAAKPSILTANAAQVLRRAGNQAIQLAYPTIATPAAFYGLERQIESLSHGQPIGIVGFSAGGSLALRIATDKADRKSVV